MFSWQLIFPSMSSNGCVIFSRDISHLIMMLLLFLVLLFFPKDVVCQGPNPNGGEFNIRGNLYTSGSAYGNNNGLIRLTNSTQDTIGQVFYNDQLRFKDSVNGTVYSFSTTFVFSIEFHYGTFGGYGLAFVICPRRGFPQTFPTTYLGLFNQTNMGDPKNHILAVELDITFHQPFLDKDANHVGIDINSLVSEKVSLAGYFKDDGTFQNLSLNSGHPMQVWIEYDSKQKQLNVTLHPLYVSKPKIPLLSLQKDLSPYLLEHMYVGFTSATGKLTASHYIFGWTFKMNGTAPDINPSRLPKIPRFHQPWIQSPKGVLAVSVTVSGVIILIILSLSLWLFMKRKKLLEVLEDWEVQFGPHRFCLQRSTHCHKGFQEYRASR